MRSAQDCKPGQIVKMDGALFKVVFWKPYKKGDRGGIIVDMKFKNIETGSMVLKSPRAQDMFEDVSLDCRKMQYSYENDGMYVFIDQETFDQAEINADVIGENIAFLKDNMEVEVFFHEGRAVSVVFPIFVTMKIDYTEDVARGDTSSKVMKKAKLETGYEIDVPSFCNIGDSIKIDTRTHEYMERVK